MDIRSSHQGEKREDSEETLKIPKKLESVTIVMRRGTLPRTARTPNPTKEGKQTSVGGAGKRGILRMTRNVRKTLIPTKID